MIHRYLLLNIITFFTVFNLVKASGFLKTQGRIIVDENDEKVILRGFGLGSWFVLEGYHWNSFPHPHSSTTNLENAIEYLVGDDKKNQFFDLYRQNYIKHKDVKFLSENGFNAIRVPLHYRDFSPEFGTFINDGFEWLDPLVNWCRDENMYLILDMHAAPGGQNPNDHSDSNGYEAKLFTDAGNRRWFSSTWRHIAEYYANEPVIGGYDLLNEPAWPGIASMLRNIYEDTIDSIRTVDPNHIIIIEGNWYGNDHTGLLPPFDNEMVYSFHHYVGSGSDSTTSDPNHWSNQYIANISSYHNVPLWVGEFGENSNHWGFNKINWFERYDIGWSWWNFKSSEDNISSLLRFKVTEEFLNVRNFWNGNGMMPDTNTAFEGLMSMARNLDFDSLIVNRGLLRALSDDTYDSIGISYNNFTPPGILPAVHYDIGNNYTSYYDNQSEDPAKFTSETKAWNSGWSYRNDGVDISSVIENGKISNYIWQFEDNEWLVYTVDIGSPRNFKLSLEVASYSKGSLLVEIDSMNVLGPIDIPITNSWDTGWRVVNLGNISIADKSKLKFKAIVGGFRMRNIIFEDVDITTLPMDLQLKCFPNPSNSYISIYWKSDFIVQTSISVYNLKGERIFDKSLWSERGGNSINWSLISKSGTAVPSGIYFIEVITPNARSYDKITHLK